MKTIASVIVAVAALALGPSAFAQFAKPEDAIKYRKNALFVMQQHYARVAGMAAGRVPFDARVAADNASVAEAVGKLPWAAFGEGTDKGDTKAKAEIWVEQAKFRDLAEKMQAELSKLSAAARTGSLDSVKAAVTATSASCKACHDAYRQ